MITNILAATGNTELDGLLERVLSGIASAADGYALLDRVTELAKFDTETAEIDENYE